MRQPVVKRVLYVAEYAKPLYVVQCALAFGFAIQPLSRSASRCDPGGSCFAATGVRPPRPEMQKWKMLSHDIHILATHARCRALISLESESQSQFTCTVLEVLHCAHALP